MKPDTVAAHATDTRPNRILIVLATAWMILSLALGGAVTAETRESAAADSVTSVTAAQP
jgi:preprotein translocase subunit SecG